ncbi:hypothetical protein C8F01DRAFT_1265457 [Mycena amicta]|nr:hypothetical protein C8F01DRAFT_1265457 [Mycena amicta]
MHFPPPNEPTDTQGYTPKSSPLRQLTSSIPFHSAVASHPSLRGHSPHPHLLDSILISPRPLLTLALGLPLLQPAIHCRPDAHRGGLPWPLARSGSTQSLQVCALDASIDSRRDAESGGASAVATTPALREAYASAMKLNWLVRRWALARMFSSSSSLFLRLTGSQTLLKHPSSWSLPFHVLCTPVDNAYKS